MENSLGIKNDNTPSSGTETQDNQGAVSDNTSQDSNAKPSSQTADSQTGDGSQSDIYPDGFDAELYNLETKSLKEEAVRDRLKRQNEEIENLKKVSAEVKNKLSNSLKAPESIEEYKTYKPDSKYDKFMNSDDGKNLFNELTDFAKDNGFTIDQHKATVDYIHNLLTKNGLIDTRSDIEKDQQQKDWITEQKKILGENADVIIKDNIDFIKDFVFFNEEQKAELVELMDRGALGVSIVNRFRELLDRTSKNGNTPIPTTITAAGLPDDETLWQKFKEAKTGAEAEKIINDRIKAGRPEKWIHS